MRSLEKVRYGWVKQVVITIGIALLLTLNAGMIMPPAWAETSGYLGNQAIAKSASLVAPDPEMEINIYPQPNTFKPRIGFGLNGDAVVVLEQTGSNGGTTWNRIQFEGSPDAEGWVQLDFLSINEPSAQAQGNNNQGRSGGYMGNRASQSTASQSTASQQDQPASPQAQQYQQQVQKYTYR